MSIQLCEVGKIINGNKVLSDISYELNKGKIYGLVGKNGSGKTMLLRAIAGLIKPTSGKIVIEGKELWKDIDFPPESGILIEKPQFIDFLTGYENLKKIAEVRQKVKVGTICDYMVKFSLDPTSKQIMKKYSLGMKQKIGIIQAVMESPEILILDEPFNALDRDSVKLLKEILLDTKEKNGIIIVTSHHEDDIQYICDEFLMIENGRLINDKL